MVSKASDDLPEPDRPVKTTSRSRGISRSTFLRLCSRAPRIVIARIAEPALYWRFALITSSISAIPGALTARVRARIAGRAGIGRQWVRSEHRKNGKRFPVFLASHQRFVAGGVATDGGRLRCHGYGGDCPSKKAGTRPAFRCAS